MTSCSRKHWSNALTRLGACEDAVEWAKTQRSFTAAWSNCERGDWMLWLAARVKLDRKLVVLAARQCARLALKCVPKGEDRPRIAVAVEEVMAADAAYAAAYAAYAADDDDDAAATLVRKTISARVVLKAMRAE